MPFQKKYTLYFIVTTLLLIAAIALSIKTGSAKIPLDQFFAICSGQKQVNPTWSYIILEYRIPKTITAICTGVSLCISGLFMQTLFRNPLAGPYVLGLSSGASLGVAFLLLASPFLAAIIPTEILQNSYSIAIAASIGSFLVLLGVSIMAYRVKDTMAILIIGLMFGSITGAMVTVLSFFASATQLQRYQFWSFGSLGNLSWQEVSILVCCTFIGVIASIFAAKTLNVLLLGDRYARSVGVSLVKSRLLIIGITAILCGSATAIVGPIAFIGLAIPHITKLLLQTTNHKIVFPAVAINGATLLLICDSIAQLPNNDLILPINAITSFIGAPIVIWMLVKQKNKPY